MNEHYTYLLVDLACLFFPLILSFQKRLPFYKNWKALLAGLLAMNLLFIPWDAFFTHLGVWGFNPKYLTGPSLLNLPLEEWLFFICIPYACVFWYECTKYFFPAQPLAKAAPYISLLYIASCIVLAINHTEQYYTLSSSLLCALLLTLHTFRWKSSYMGWFHLAWFILLIPFYISNGILTGLQFWKYPFFNEEPQLVSDQIVWYNNDHNISFRIWSVPFEDFFYGMFMILLVVTVYEKVLKNRIKKPA